MGETVNLKGDLLRRLQLVELEILKVTAHFCEAHNLQYCLSSGTLLGAVRHGGFIPWDDDIDISMPRKDFEKFLSMASQFPQEYVVQATRIDPHYPLGMAKIRKKGTIMREPALANLPIEHGVWIDVFPLDQIEHKENLLFRSHMIAFCSTVLYAKLGITFPSKFTTRLACQLCGLVEVKKMDQLRTAFMAWDEKKNCKYLTSYASNLGSKNLLFSKETYFPLRKIVFEGHSFFAPNDVNCWLHGAYGDYMIMPPVEQQINRHKICELKI